MNPSVLPQAINEAFPNLDEALRMEISNKVSAHMFEVLKDKVYANDAEGLQKLNQIIQAETEGAKRSEFYLKQIVEKLVSLSSDDQKRIDKELDEELTRVMHEIYKSYE